MAPGEIVMGAQAISGKKRKSVSKFQPTEARLPGYLKSFLAQGAKPSYSFMDRAGWRYIMKVSREFFASAAHEKYLKGLDQTGITTEDIPSLQEMDQSLQRFGWGAVAVHGFVPPGIFMELMARGVLPIATAMRRLEHLDYTPAPDLVHESAGHAPLLVDPAYSEFLHHCGSMALRCIGSKRDFEQYEVIREISDLKEDISWGTAQGEKDQDRLRRAEKRLAELYAEPGWLSEAAQFGRLIWWTVEYGLVGTMRSPRIYGAGLLSSVGESFHCLSSKVKKIRLDLGCTQVGYDITKPQPQLFVTPDFEFLSEVSEEFGRTLSWRKGPEVGLGNALKGQAPVTLQWDSGVQVCGVVESYERRGPGGRLSWVKFSGPVQICYGGHELKDQGVDVHAQGYSTPFGPLKGAKGMGLNALPPLSLGPTELEWESGMRLSGHLVEIWKAPRRDGGHPLVYRFDLCSVWNGQQLVYDPQWGPFDLICGEGLDSVCGGVADPEAYDRDQAERYRQLVEQKLNRSSSLISLAESKRDQFYGDIRKLREARGSLAKRREVWQRLAAQWQRDYSQEWLAGLELWEWGQHHREGHTNQIRRSLITYFEDDDVVTELLNRGFRAFRKLKT